MPPSSRPRADGPAIRDVTPADADAVCAIINPIIETRAYTVFDAPFTVEAERDYMRGFPRAASGSWRCERPMSA